jgi:beta-glucosidase
MHRAIHHVNLSHGAAVDAIRARVRGAAIGAIHSVQPCLPSSPTDADAEAARRCDAIGTASIDSQCCGACPELLQPLIAPHMQPGDLERIHRPLDWFGLSHYSLVYVRADAEARFGFNFGDRPPGTPATPNDWPMIRRLCGGTLRRFPTITVLPVT